MANPPGGNIGARPTRAVLVNTDLPIDVTPAIPRALEFMLNPEQLRYHLAAAWARISIPGLSHDVSQWSHSESTEVSFDLEWSWQEAMRRLRMSGANRLVEDQRLILSPDEDLEVRKASRYEYLKYHEFLGMLTVPLDRGFAPSRVAMTWPNFMSMTAVVDEVDFTFQQWSLDGTPMRFVAAIEMHELRVTFRRRINRFSLFQDRGGEEEAEFGTADLALTEADTTVYDLLGIA